MLPIVSLNSNDGKYRKLGNVVSQKTAYSKRE